MSTDSAVHFSFCMDHWSSASLYTVMQAERGVPSSFDGVERLQHGQHGMMQ